MNKFALSAVALLSSLVTTQVLAADSTGFYIGGALNQTTLDDSYDSISGTGLGLYGGYNFNSWFGLESNLFGSGDLGEQGFDISVAVFNVTPKFTWQVNETFGLYAKIGLASAAVNVSGYGIDEDFTGYGWTFGVGMNMAMTENLNLRLSYDVTEGELEADHYDFDDFDGEIQQLAIGLHYQF
ncbi:porin family protein [Shewanella acanthi]|uniref:porin family protein n=1 Tax=Shewanella acanthi TaxID=2864212 RepID=UPI001C658F6A|nr:porin family protein [Shewanella acanthi]QYJ79063.1 porin family protein [Shewanella acanthi]